MLRASHEIGFFSAMLNVQLIQSSTGGRLASQLSHSSGGRRRWSGSKPSSGVIVPVASADRLIDSRPHGCTAAAAAAAAVRVRLP